MKPLHLLLPALWFLTVTGPLHAQKKDLALMEQQAAHWLQRPDRHQADTAGLSLLNDLAVMHMMRNDGLKALGFAQTAVAHGERMLTASRGAEQRLVRDKLCDSYSLLCLLLRQQMAFDQAADVAHRYIREAKLSGNNSAISSAYGQLARCHEQLGDPASALPLRWTEWSYARKASGIDLAECHLRLGQVHATLGNADSAAYHFQRGLVVNDSVQAPHKSLSMFAELISLYASMGEEELMEQYASRLNAIAVSVPMNIYQQRVHEGRARIQFMKGSYQAAIAELVRADSLPVTAPNKAWRSMKHRLLALAFAGDHQQQPALQHLDSAMAEHTASLGLEKVRALARLQAEKEHERELQLAQAQVQVERGQKWLMAVVTSSMLALGLLGGLLLRSTRIRARMLAEKNAQILAAQAQLVRSEKQREAEQVRIRIARDIHDEVGAELTRIRLLSSEARHLLSKDPEAASSTMDRMYLSAKEATDALRDIVWSTDPTHDQLRAMANHLSELLNRMTEGSGAVPALSLEIHDPDRIVEPGWRNNLLRIVKEAIHNSVKHAGARAISLSFKTNGDEFTLSITDDGAGFRTSDASDGNGLRNMRERCEAMSATMQLMSGPDQGCSITVAGSLPNALHEADGGSIRSAA